MRYREEEIKKLKDNTKQIETYLRKSMPNLRARISIGFGDEVGTKLRMRYTLWIDVDDLYFDTGLYNWRFDDPSFSVYNNNDLMAYLTKDWQWIKHKLIEAMNEQRDRIENIWKFKV